MLVRSAVARWLPAISRRIQPWVARIGNTALNIVLVTTIIGYLPDMPDLILSGALAVGLAFFLAAFGIGYLAGWGNDALEDIGGLATTQRNTAAAILIAISSFTNPVVFVLIALVSTVGIAMLLVIAKLLRGDNARVVPFWLGPE